MAVTAEYPILSSIKVFFCLKLRISITKKPIGLLILSKLYIGPVMVLGHSIFQFKSLAHLNVCVPIEASDIAFRGHKKSYHTIQMTYDISNYRLNFQWQVSIHFNWPMVASKTSFL